MLDKLKIIKDIASFKNTFDETVNEKRKYNDEIIISIMTSKMDKKKKTIEQIRKCGYGFVLSITGDKYKIHPLLCKSKYCAICRYFFVAKQRQGIINVYNTLQKHIRKTYPIYYIVVTKQGIHNETALLSLMRLKEMFKNMYEKNRKTSIILGGFYKIEYTYSIYSFNNWHYHCNFVIESVVDEKILLHHFEEHFNTRLSIREIDLDQSMLMDIIKYSAKEESTKLKEWNLDPFLHHDLIYQLSQIFKKRHLSLMQSWLGLRGLYKDCFKDSYEGENYVFNNENYEEMLDLIVEKTNNDLLVVN